MSTLRGHIVSWTAGMCIMFILYIGGLYRDVYKGEWRREDARNPECVCLDINTVESQTTAPTCNERVSNCNTLIGRFSCTKSIHLQHTASCLFESQLG